jgi:tetratricopeptide (TPR) repeat protein
VGTKSGRIFFGLIFLLVAACPALAQEAGKIMSMVGTAEVLRKERWQSVSLYEVLQAGEVVRTGPGSRVAVLLADGSQLKVNANSHLELKQVTPPVRKAAMGVLQTILRLLSGEIWIRSYVEPFEIETKAITATIRGTELNLAIEPAEATRLTVVEGVVEFRNPQGSVFVAAKEQAIAKPGEAPRKVVIINPRDAVQWALYYPPLIDYRQVPYPEGPDAQAICRALEHYHRGALPETLRSLEQVPPERRDARFFTLRAGLLLSISQVAEARADIDEALRRNPSEATAYALRSIIALVQNQKEKALSLARKAAELEPQSPVPQVALSYAYQATFDLEKALKSLEQAAKLAPEDALIQARLAELELSRGELERALKAARRAAALDPELARTHTVLGFAYLTQIRTVQAKAAFERAITLDSTDPLPRLGLGLAKIRESNLVEGVREIEIAASLDPNNSLIRSYLGKAYYEEKREDLAARGFAIAKELDPRDPTPYFYDAIRKHSVNRPVEAFQDLRRSVKLNDNRAVYRSRLLLDEDLAARGAALGRIYRELGFQQQALVEGWKSLSQDPTDYTAHRLLSDSYSVLPRHEIARVSELLQSQLLQPINITPVQPQLAESELFLLGGLGPAEPSLNEFNPLFQRNRFSLLASGLVGTQETYSDELVHSGLWNNLSYSLGQFHYETEGFRTNNDIDVDIYNAFVQGSITPKLNVQTEFRHREVEHGDLDLLFEHPNGTRPTFRSEADSDAFRLGVHIAPSKHSDLIGSFIYQDADSEHGSDPRNPTRGTSEGYITEAQYLYHHEVFAAVLGGGYYQLDEEVVDSFDSTAEHGNAYLYSYIRFPASVIWSLGLSVDAFEQEEVFVDPEEVPTIETIHVTNPKFGVLWTITPDTVFRAAVFKTFTRSLLANQTLEPTQVAGFNQFFDDPGLTESVRWGAGIDHRFSSALTGGAEVSKRDLDIPDPSRNDGNEDWKESLYRVYLHWTPHPRWAATIEYFKEDFDNMESSGPRDTETQVIPMSVSYFNPSGLFAKFRASYLHQEVALDTEPDGDDATFLDLSLGSRLPKRWGIFEVQFLNLLNQDYRYQGLGNRRAPTQTSVPPFLPFPPEFTVFARMTLAF